MTDGEIVCDENIPYLTDAVVEKLYHLGAFSQRARREIRGKLDQKKAKEVKRGKGTKTGEGRE